jgi:hypothetical protein
MPTIRLRDDQWAKVWRMLTKVGPIHRLPESGKVYSVSDAHIAALRKHNMPFEQLYPHKKEYRKEPWVT